MFNTTRGYPQALPCVPDLTAAAAILFSTLELREVILRHSHVYQTLRRQAPSSLGYPQALPRLPNLTAAAQHSRHLVEVILRHFRVYLT